MAHHSSQPMGESFRQQMEIEAQRQGLGATGRSPSGSVHDTDEGEIRIGVASDERNDKVILNFGKPVAWIAFDPPQAVEIAQALIKHARNTSKEPLRISIN